MGSKITSLILYTGAGAGYALSKALDSDDDKEKDDKATTASSTTMISDTTTLINETVSSTEAQTNETTTQAISNRGISTKSTFALTLMCVSFLVYRI